MCVQVLFQHDVVVLQIELDKHWLYLNVFFPCHLFVNNPHVFMCLQNMLSALCHIYLCLAWQQQSKLRHTQVPMVPKVPKVWYGTFAMKFPLVTHSRKYICMCICLKSGLWGCPNYSRVKAGYTLDEKPSALSRTVKELPCLVWTVGGNERTHTKLGSPKALSSFQTCCHVYELKEICVW